MQKRQPARAVKDAVHPRGTIKDWPADERPREKLLTKGAEALSDAELLAILIRTGTATQSALDLARGILHQEQSLRSLGTKNPHELMRARGIGRAKAVELLAALEIGRRVQAARGEGQTIIRGPEEVARFMLPRMRDLMTEEFFVLTLDSKNGLKSDVRVTSGTVNASLVHPREVFKTAIDHRAAAVIVVHNHPSGNPEPSREDVEVTRQLVQAGNIIGIPVHDHVILAGDSYVSLAERGLLRP